MKLQDIVFNDLARKLLEENGRLDCNKGIPMYDGWCDCATQGGFTPTGRTPAREAYEDGYYSGTFGSTKKAS